MCIHTPTNKALTDTWYTQNQNIENFPSPKGLGLSPLMRRSGGTRQRNHGSTRCTMCDTD